MREMIFNHASISAFGWHDILAHLPEIADGMMHLCSEGVVNEILRMNLEPGALLVDSDHTLFDAYLELLRCGQRDKAVFLMRLGTMVPLIQELDCGVVDRLDKCESGELSTEDGRPLLICAITDSVSISFPSTHDWDRDVLQIEFQEMLPDKSYCHVKERIDNLARSRHSQPILERHRQQIHRNCKNLREMWKQRSKLFPNLLFGLEVEDHLSRVNAMWFRTIMNRLEDLDRSTAEWQQRGGADPDWKCNVSPESPSVSRNPRLRKKRLFKTSDGQKVLFMRHARFGSGGRSHFRTDATERRVEIGYIGKHLPL